MYDEDDEQAFAAAEAAVADEEHREAQDPALQIAPGGPIRFQVSGLPDAWADLDDIDLAAEFRTSVTTIRSVPTCIRGEYARIQTAALRALSQASRAQADAQTLELRAWKLFLLLPRMVLCPTGRGGEAGARILRRRVRMFDDGQWGALLQASRQVGRRSVTTRAFSEAEAFQAKLRAATALIEKGELSHAARVLKSAGLAPGNTDTLRQLTDPQCRPPDPPAAS